MLRAAEWLSQAVKIPDDMGPVGGDDRWDVFGPFHDYLLPVTRLTHYPIVLRCHSNLELTTVNTRGIIFVWIGSDDTKKPLLLAGHRDVVPVDLATIEDWVYPSYSGYYDGQQIWGRGASDDKNGLISIPASIETLLEASFEPTRTIVLAFGFDEESSGEEGARKLGVELEKRFGKGTFLMIIDEGDGSGEKFGTIFAIPAISENGYLDVKIEVTTPRGHSSLPPEHTSIGILAALLVELENKPHPTRLCFAEHAGGLPASLRDSIKRASHSKEALLDLERRLTVDKTLMIDGGIKANALPEQAWALINHHISAESSVGETTAYDADILRPLAKAFNLTYATFGVKMTERGTGLSGALTLSDAWGTALEPALVTPIYRETSPYALLAGTIKATYNLHRDLTGDNIVVSPGILVGNTDTQSYWNLSEYMLRYNHQDSSNESDAVTELGCLADITVDGYMEMIQFFATLILNMDESTLP
ncbi:Zn-dependent exopeptidase [Pleurotus eryngii]|uniref:Zn-dependent exopeptidase n=1 Tax=Pleurotus eryngii TaxID=5323 RepID=A0A9P5ZX64_PLEER|nr:Zn-dependent exopeptidase [Pleurotus eryngii]